MGRNEAVRHRPRAWPDRNGRVPGNQARVPKPPSRRDRLVSPLMADQGSAQVHGTTRKESMLNGPQEQNFDYVVVGAGSAGAVVAARLSEDPSLRVALIEAGPGDEGIDEVLTLNRWMELLASGYDWDYPVEEQENGNSFMRMARAKVLGGCSSHNSCIAFWAPAEDIDEWEKKFGATGWNAEMAFRLY